MKTIGHRRNQIKTALLLAAGTGNRLQPCTFDLPKCLTEVNETAILERLIHVLRAWKFERLIVVVGHLDSCVREFLDRSSGGLTIEYIYSAEYRSTNNIYSLWKARHTIHEPFLLLECDLIFDEALLAGMLEPGRIAVSRNLTWMNGTAVSVDPSRLVTRFHLNGGCVDQPTYKTVNMYSFSLASWRHVTRRLERHIEAGLVNGYYETVFSELVEEKSLFFEAVFFDSNRWYEIDTIEDLHEAERIFPKLDGRPTCGAIEV
jgi:choline kinase